MLSPTEHQSSFEFEMTLCSPLGREILNSVDLWCPLMEITAGDPDIWFNESHQFRQYFETRHVGHWESCQRWHQR